MPSPLNRFPDLQTLEKNINSVLGTTKPSKLRVKILARELNIYASIFPSESVKIRLADGSELKLLCKYEAGQEHGAFGHRGGVSYEAEVYRQVLQLLPISTPRYYGTYEDPNTHETWLIIEYFEDTLSIKHAGYLEAMQAAARWLGEFHQRTEALLSKSHLPFLKRLDFEYLIGWAHRTSIFAGDLHQRYPWLELLCRRFEDIAAILIEPSNVIIHGEYYPNNVLFANGDIYPIDWESAAVATGEIDLASLTEDWPPDYESVALTEYKLYRWPEITPTDFERKLDTARIYWHFRWLGERREWTVSEAEQARFEKLKIIGERLGLI